ncbi:hypothetical protein BH10PSE9_BH10PSE9_13590 [soil metagenome]
MRERGKVIPHSEIFNFVYATDVWYGGSGAGSSEAATVTYRAYLSGFLREKKIRSVVDAGCGDWQSSRLIDWTGIHYLGIDVSSVALKNTAQYSSSSIQFREGDVRSDDLPGANLLLMKDVLQHWPTADILAFLPKLGRFRFCLITNDFDPNRRFRPEIRAGAHEPVDLTKPPFLLRGVWVLKIPPISAQYFGREPCSTELWQPDRAGRAYGSSSVSQ